ncbi:MAG: hypothetical protein WC263_02525 [Candidatus Micrarchaeia archaeon]|jgi:hypothetical protein
MAFDLNAFLKPSWKKAAIAALLFILFVPFINHDNGIRCIRAPCPSSSVGSFASWLLFGPWAHSQPAHVYSIDLFIALIGIAVCYALACALLGWKKGKKK